MESILISIMHQDDPDLVQFQDHAPPHAIALVQEVDTIQGPILLPQEGEVTILFRLDRVGCILGLQELLLWSEKVSKSAGHILQVMAMPQIIMQPMDMMRNLFMALRRHETSGGPLHVEHQGRPLGHDQGLLICLLDMTDEMFGNIEAGLCTIL